MWGLTAFGILPATELTLLYKVINVVVAVASLALTAFNIQALKGAYYAVTQQAGADQKAIESRLGSLSVAGALSLYINFMNLFLALLQLLRR